MGGPRWGLRGSLKLEESIQSFKGDIKSLLPTEKQHNEHLAGVVKRKEYSVWNCCQLKPLWREALKPNKLIEVGLMP